MIHGTLRSSHAIGWHAFTRLLQNLLSAVAAILYSFCSGQTRRRDLAELLLRLRGHDERALCYLVQRRRLALDRIARRLTHLGDAAVVIALVLAMLLSKTPTLVAAGRLAALSLTISHVLVQLLKRSICRPRPELPTGIASLVRAPDRFSFPSGHAAASLALALALAPTVAGPVGLAILVLGLLVGATRCYLGVHFPGDVLVGWFLAALATLLAATL